MKECCAICKYCKEIYNGEHRYNSIRCEFHNISLQYNRLGNKCEHYIKEE